MSGKSADSVYRLYPLKVNINFETFQYSCIAFQCLMFDFFPVIELSKKVVAGGLS